MNIGNRTWTLAFMWWVTGFEMFCAIDTPSFKAIAVVVATAAWASFLTRAFIKTEKQ